MIDRISTNETSHVVSVKVVDVEKRYRPGPKHYVYVIQVTWSNPTNIFIIYRRYAQFFDLQCKLLDLFAEAPSPSNNYKSQPRQIPFLPGKIFLGRSQIRQIALERKQALNIYCQTLISLPEHISRSRPVLQFFQPLPTDVQNSSETTTNERKTVAKESVIISRPLKLPTYRCFSDFEAVEKIEMSLKKNTLVEVIHKHLNGWWFVQNGDRKGFVPGAFLEPIEQQQQSVLETDDFSRTGNETYIVNKSYEAMNRDEISLDQGSFAIVLEKSFTGWWIVKFHDRTGQFPAVYLTSCKGRIIPETIPSTESTTVLQRLSSLKNYERNDNDELPSANVPELFYVHTDFHDDVGDCVSLQRGDVVEIHDKHSSGWWLGRRLKDDFILTWLPSAFLQKEPILDTYITDVHAPTYPTVSVEGQSQISMNNIYQNINNRLSTETVYSEEMKNVQPVLSGLIVKHASLPSIDNEVDTTRVSVRDLVKKFNKQ
ncbi:unnamed protein product [Adineta ricciae]|uniref:Uncharacterized protein n=1 Tax=Adineta ricciae TaxID=249248 RepID=A0A814P1Z5_ADIRI|nr:unnamed protein product [Adineta ricciae]